MAEKDFTRRYRSSSIDEYLGEKLRRKMKAIFRNEDSFPQKILLHGTRGCGKTTLARIIAKEYLCEDRKDGHACGKCSMCKEIDDNLIFGEIGQTAFGVMELDASNDSGKEAITDLLQDSLEEPMYPLKRKVYILDECHMLSKGAQNALLKTLEEPPKWSVYILCTTDPEKLLGTVRDRCQEKLKVKKANLDELVDRLEYICRQEGIKTSRGALKMIVNSCNRNPRDSMMKLESISKTYGKTVLLEQVVSELDEVTDEVYMEYYRSANKGLSDVMQFSQKLKDMSIEPLDFINGLVRFTIDCLNIKYGVGLDNYSSGQINAVKEMFSTYNTEDLDCLLQILEHAGKTISSNLALGELMISTTAMRISKIKLLAVGLQHEAEQAELENRKGMKKATAAQAEEKEAVVLHSEVNSSLMKSMFGKNVAEVQSEIPVSGPGDSDEEEVDSGEHLTDDDLLSLFG